MSLMRQVSLLPAGCQPWNLDVCAASSNGDRFAYCATLAVYVYEVSDLGSRHKRDKSRNDIGQLLRSKLIFLPVFQQVSSHNIYSKRGSRPLPVLFALSGLIKRIGISQEFVCFGACRVAIWKFCSSDCLKFLFPSVNINYFCRLRYPWFDLNRCLEEWCL